MEKQNWKRFIEGETRVLTQLPSKIATSWRFCLQNNVDPFLVRPPKILTASDLSVKQQEYQELTHLVKNELKNLDKRMLLDNALFILTDHEGTILWRTGNYQARDLANTIAFREGSNWSELAVGTNAIGLAIRTKEDEYLSLEEHYSAASRHWSCAASPILDENNDLVGVLDISTYQNSSAKEALLLLTLLTQKISNQLMQQHFKNRNQLLEYAQHSLDDVIFCDGHHRMIKVPTADSDRFRIGDDIRKVLKPSMIYDQEAIVENRHLLGYKYKVYKTKKAGMIKEKQMVYLGVESQNKEYQHFLKQVTQLADSSAPIHIFGESGSGKEIVSQTIHYNSPFSEGPLLAINCGAVNESLLESELFGYAPGAFTGANAKGFEGKLSQANGGTLFLDEIDSMPEKMQQSLLRVLEDKVVTPISGKATSTEFRLVTASNRDLRKLVQEGKFREDLYYRLFVCTLRIPPLRERLEDLVPLIHRFSKEHHWSVAWQSKISEVASQYPWHGNIREFNNFLLRLSIFYPIKEPTKAEMNQLIQSSALYAPELLNPSSPKLSEAERIANALSTNHYNRTKAAQWLGISRATLYRKIKKYGLES